jgi:hypothetical protein
VGEIKIKKVLSKFFYLIRDYYLCNMEMAVILKRDLKSRVANVTLRKGSMVIYSDKMKAVKTEVSSRRSEVWIGAKEKDFIIVGWKQVK